MADTAVATTTTQAPQLPDTLGKGIYSDLPALMDAFNQARAHYNVLFPVMKPDLIPPLHAVALRPVAIDCRLYDQAGGKIKIGDPVSGDLYRDSRDPNKYALTKIALDKIAAAANLSWHPAYTGRVDDQSNMHFRTYRACGVVLGLDGTPRLITAHKSLDLRDGAPHGMTEKQLPQARQHIDALCESKAMNRVLRKFAFIQGMYTAAELKRPFVIAALVFTGQTEDPELRKEVAKALVARSTNASAALFGPAPGNPAEISDLGQRTAPPPVGTVVDGEGEDDPPAPDATGADAPTLF